MIGDNAETKEVDSVKGEDEAEEGSEDKKEAEEGREFEEEGREFKEEGKDGVKGNARMIGCSRTCKRLDDNKEEEGVGDKDGTCFGRFEKNEVREEEEKVEVVGGVVVAMAIFDDSVCVDRG